MKKVVLEYLGKIDTEPSKVCAKKLTEIVSKSIDSIDSAIINP